MSRKKSSGTLSDDERKLWHKVTENITRLDSNRAATPLVRRAAYRIAVPDVAEFDYGVARAPVLTEQSFSLRDADHNWRQKLRRGKMKPEGKIDLHGMTEDRAYAALARYIEEAQRRGKRIILVITGKGGKTPDDSRMPYSEYNRGRGILKTNVPRWLSRGDPGRRIISYYAANAEHGGDGALYVVLKRNRGRPQ